jgi:hypothetical protein
LVTGPYSEESAYFIEAVPVGGEEGLRALGAARAGARGPGQPGRGVDDRVLQRPGEGGARAPVASFGV